MSYRLLIIGIMLLLSVMTIQVARIKELRSDVEVLETKARALNDRIRSANEIARDASNNAQIQNNQIYSIQIASDCPAAITWGISQAKEFK